MANSKSEKPCFYLQASADITEMVKMRPELRRSTGVKVTTNAFFLHALAMAAAEFPLMIGRLTEDKTAVSIPRNLNVGFAVNAPQGLVVPVIRKADRKNILQIAAEERELTAKARDNKLKLKDIDAETIALSNLGAYDIDSFFAINPPQTTTIMALGNILRRMLPVNGKCEHRRTVTLSLAVDHRIVNGLYAAKFLAKVKSLLENPNILAEGI